MERITTYSARRGNIFVWMAVLFMAASTVFRIIWLTGTDGRGLLFVILGILIPLAGSLILMVRLPIRGEKYFYVTVRPVICMCIGCIYYCFAFQVYSTVFWGPEWPFSLPCSIYLIVLMVLYYLTFSGKIATKIPVMIIALVPVIVVVLRILGVIGIVPLTISPVLFKEPRLLADA